MLGFIKLLLVFASLASQISSPFFLPDFSLIEKELLIEGQDFIEVDLEENKVFLFEKGKLKEEFEILAKGDPQNWGGTPAGLYSVLNKYKLAYSNISHVYMPYSVRFWGKYYLHGEPYYKNRRRLGTSWSGGCIRLKNSSAKKVFDFAKKGTPVLVIDKTHQKSWIFIKNPKPKIQAESYLIADLDSGQVFLHKNDTIPYPLGKISSFLIATTLSEIVDLRKEIKISGKMVKEDSFFTGQDAYGLVELFYLLFLDDSKEIQRALINFLGERKTKELIQQKIQAILMKNTTFNSFEDLNQNKGSARDLFYLARYILNVRPPIFAITRGESVSFAGQFKESKLFPEQNSFSSRQDFIGGKKDSVEGLGEVGFFVFQVKIKDQFSRRVAIIILGADNIEKEVEKILNWLNESKDKT